MYESGDLVVPRVQDRPRLNKPPLIYWLQCASIAVFGDREGQYSNANIWVFRLPSVLCAIGSVLLTWRLGLSMFDPRAAVLAAAMLAVCPMVVWDAHQARADQLLLLTTTATMLGLWKVWASSRGARTRRERDRARDAQRASETSPPTQSSTPFSLATARGSLFWGSLALGILAKGPITPMIAGLTALALCMTTRRWRWVLSIRSLAGVVIMLAIVAPWVYAVGERVGWGTYVNTIFDETLGRSGAAKEGHWGPPGYHLVLLVVLFWPGVLLTGAAFVRALKLIRRTNPECQRAGSSHSQNIRANNPKPPRSRSGFVPRPELFLLAWIVPSWVVFELIATKLPHYTMPMYPAIALLSARGLLAATTGGLNWFLLRPQSAGPLAGRFTFATSVGFGVWAMIALLASAIATQSTYNLIPGGVWPSNGAAPSLFAVIAFLACAAFVVFAAKALKQRRYQRAIMFAIAVSILSWFVFLQFGAPYCLPGVKSVRMLNYVNLADPRSSRPLASVYHEDSLIFWTRGRVERINADQIEDWLAAHPDGVAIVPAGPTENEWKSRGFDSFGKVPVSPASFTVIRRSTPSP